MKFSQIEYKKLDFEALLNEMKILKEKIKKAKTAKEQLDFYNEAEIIISEFRTYFSLVRIRNLQDVNDEFYNEEKTLYANESPKFFLIMSEIYEVIHKSPFRKELEQKMGSIIFKNIEISSKTKSEEILKDKQKENLLVQDYIKTISSLTVWFDGKNIPLTQLIPYKESVDRDTRIRAHIAEGECYNSVKPKFDEIFDELVKNRTMQATKLGFNNFVDLGYAKMERNCYNFNDVFEFKNQVLQEITPKLLEIREKRRKRLNIDELKFYDLTLSCKEGTPKPILSGIELVNAAKIMYNKMNTQTAEFFNDMCDNELFDVLSRKGKSPGGFCSYLDNFKKTFVFANFNNTSADVNVLLHEVGHAFARYILVKNAQIIYNFYTLDISETHSMTMEFLTEPYYDMFFGTNASKYKKAHNPNLSARERDNLWLEIESKFRPNTDYDDLPFYSKGAGWQRQMHIYKTPFYYIDYCLAQTMALQFYSAFLKDKELAFNKYMEFIKKSNEKTFLELIELIGFKSPFDDGTIKHIISSLK